MSKNLTQTQIDTGIDVDRLNLSEDLDNHISPNTLTRETPEVAFYQCGWCGFAHASERTVRAHITIDETGQHKNRNGFLDNIYVQAYDSDGELIGDMASPRTTSFESEVTEENLPSTVTPDTKAAEIVMQAISKPYMAPSEIAEEVYENPDNGNISYVSRVIRNHLTADSDVENSEENMSTTHKPSELKTYEDLEPPQKVIINEFIRDPTQAKSEIEHKANVSAGYAQRTLEKYARIVNIRQHKVETEELELPDPDEVLKDYDGNNKSYDDLSPQQQRLIDNWVINPDKTKTEIEEASGASPGYSARTYRKYHDIREQRRKAFKQGILDKKHLNTPPKSEFMDSDGNKLPKSEQPRGVSLKEAKQNTSEETASEFVSVENIALEDVQEHVEALESRINELETMKQTKRTETVSVELIDTELSKVLASLSDERTEEVQIKKKILAQI